ncbi:hypothetical protein I3843_06G099300 [Carya illinoinensis]|nr:hypothetical protein I3843_06G099300 [Carya illinoinensis]
MGGKLLCDSTTVAETFQTSSPTVPWRDPQSAAAARDAIEAVDLVDQTTTTAWDDVHGLEEQQRRHLQRLHAKGILWKHPADDSSSSVSVVFRLSHGGEVSADGNCLFTASQKAMGGSGTARVFDARELRRRTVRRFLEDFGSVGAEEREAIEEAIKHMYAPDLKNGWGIHVVQELKLLAKKSDRLALDSAIDELLQLGVQRCFFLLRSNWFRNTLLDLIVSAEVDVGSERFSHLMVLRLRSLSFFLSFFFEI